MSSPAPARAAHEIDTASCAAVFDSIGDAILIVDADGTVVEMNRAASELLGVASAAELGLDWSRLFPALDVELLLEHRGDRAVIETQLRMSRTERIPVGLTAGQYRGPQGDFCVLAVRDMRPSRMAQKRVMERERLVAIGQTMTALAHESRNALQRMQACLTLIRLRGNEEIRELVDDMQSAQTQLRDLYEEVRSYAAPMHLEREAVDVERLVANVWRELRMLWMPKELRLEIEVAPGVNTELAADPARLGQVFRNLLENAIEASPAEGVVRVPIREADLGHPPRLELCIEDAGPGIAAENRQRVFDLLFTTKPDGTGMGLAIAQRIVLAHDGELSVDSAMTAGCRIRMILPRT